MLYYTFFFDSTYEYKYGNLRKLRILCCASLECAHLFLYKLRFSRVGDALSTGFAEVATELADRVCLMKKRFLFLFAVIISAAAMSSARYKAPTWEPSPRESYPAFLTSEGVTIAVDPLYTDDRAARVFDKNDMITRGIMPFAVVIFNDNSFSVEISGLDIELIHKNKPDIHIKTISPNEVTWRLLQRKKDWYTGRVPRLPLAELDRDMLNDFDGKYLMKKTVEAHGKAGGFLYMHLPEKENAAEFLSGALLYIPKIYRIDNGSRMIYFEISLDRAVAANPAP